MALDVVVFDNSGSMGGKPIETAFTHALRTYGKDAEWRICGSGRLQGGRLGDRDAYDRICSFMGPPTIRETIVATAAPGVRMIVYTDEVPMAGQEDPFIILDGIGGTIHFVAAGQQWAHDAIGSIEDAHPDLRVALLDFASA